MNDDVSTATALQEIAALLRRRVEQEDEAVVRHEKYSKASDERLAKLTTPDLSKIEEDAQKRGEEMKQRMRETSELSAQIKAKTESETREFREKLLAEFGRHNDLLERIAAQLEKSRLI